MNSPHYVRNPAEARLIAEEIIESSPSIALRVVGENGKWIITFITKNVSKLGYAHEDFASGHITWMDIVHPDDLDGLVAAITDYNARGVRQYKNIYRVLRKDGEVEWVTDDSNEVYDQNGVMLYSDCIISDYTETRRHIEKIEDHYRQSRVLKEILLGMHDADPDKAVQIILDSTGVYLDISRVILFQDDPDHKTCRAIHEWCNTGIASAGDLTIDYEKDIPEIAHDLISKGHRIVNFGDIPPGSTREFDSEGVISAAIFGVNVENERFGFICFDECVKERFWPDDTVRFLQNIANLVAPAIIKKRNVELINSITKILPRRI